jgi:nucleotide-binding universal stress UspA family protein
MKNILLLVHDDSAQESRLQAALDLCRAVGGHVTCLDVTYVPPILAGGGAYDDSYAIAELLTLEKTREAANKTKLEARLANEDVTWDWIDATGDIAPCLERAAALADVIVVNRQVGDFAYPDMRGAAADLVVRSGKPILAVPSDCRALNLNSAFVAWDGSPCAANALQAAVPLLQRTDHVTIIEVGDGSVATPAEDAALYLSRHDVHARIDRIPVAPGSAATVLLEKAASGDFGYGVMGGYGHRRVTEALFGGVTRTMLSESPVPLLLAH